MKGSYGKSMVVGLLALSLLPVFAGDIVYVKAKGSNTEPYDTEEKAATTLDTAVAYANAQGIRKVKVVGQVNQSTQLTIENVEIYGDGWEAAKLYYNQELQPTYKIGANVFVHDLQFTGTGRSKGIFRMIGSDSVISNCWINGIYGQTAYSGSEVAGWASAGLITHCKISNCRTNNGGNDGTIGVGVLALEGTACMINSIFTGNYHSYNTRGPCDGVLRVSGNARLENCVVYGNYAKASSEGDSTSVNYRPRRGGGIFVKSGSPTIRNCIVRNNKKPHTPSDGKYPTETEEEIYTASEEGDFYIASGATPTIENCNTVEGQIPECAVNCQTGDPKFTDPDNSKLESRDFHIAADSPCVDAGKFVDWQNFVKDYSGVSARYQGEGVDIGAYEVTKSQTPVKATVAFDDPAEGQGEKYSTVSLSVTSVAGSTLRDDAAYTWYTSDPREGSPEPIATGMSTSYRFTAGTWTVYLKIANAGGVGQDFVMAVPNAVTVQPGADYYVSAKGDDENTGDIDAPLATLTCAVEKATAAGKRKIKVVGTVTQNTQLALENVEIYGGGWDKSCLHHTAGSVKPVFNIKANVSIHGLKFTSGHPYLRALYYLTESSSVISNCWFSGLYCNTIQENGEIAGRATAGLITHCLFSGNYSNNGGGEGLKYGLGVLSLSGTARMVNSVFTGNGQNNNTRGPNDGLLTVADNAVLENCVIYDNYAKSSSAGDNDKDYKDYYRPRNGAGVCVRSGSPVIRNCIIRKNLKPHAYSPEGGDIYNPTEEGDIYIAPGATPKISNCNLPEGQVPAGATDCQTGDPLFTDPDNATLSKRNFMIGVNSPCRNAGRGWKWQKFVTDYTGVQPRRQGGRVDIGAYEYPDGVVVPGLMLIVR